MLSLPLPLSAQSAADSAAQIELHALSAVVLDAASGAVLYEKNPNLPIPPASLTKLMTTHVALSEAAARGISLDERFELPEESWWRNQPPRSSLMFIEEGQRASLHELLLGLAIPSGNDAAVAIALRFAPTVADFAAMMNTQARKFALESTIFVEPSGISEQNFTTALEFARFCKIYLQLHPETIKNYHTVSEFIYPQAENMPPERKNSPPVRIHRNHVGLVGTYPGADGLKTGYIDESGYNLAASAVRGGTRFIAVILGVPTENGAYWGPRYRDADGEALLDWAFEHYKTIRIAFPALKPARIWKGAESRVKVAPPPDFPNYPEFGAFTVERGRGERVSYKIKMLEGLLAPLPAGTRAGTLTYFDDAGEIAQVPLLTSAAVPEGNAFQRLWDAILMFFSGVN